MLTRTLDISGSRVGRERDRMAILPMWEHTANKMVQRFKEAGHPFFNSTSALDRGILNQKGGKNTTHFNGDLVNTELLFQTVHSVTQISVYAAVTDWCYQFGLTDEEKRTCRCSCGQ